MNDILFDYLDDFCTAYLDDILIYSDNVLDHTMHVRKVLQRLIDAGLQADLKKCEFDVTSTKYLGFIISTEGVQVDPEKVAIVTSWGAPTTVKGIQSFLGFCNFSRRFIQNYGMIAQPLVHLTKANVPFNFSPECEHAFYLLKLALTSAPVLQHYRQDLPCLLETDASDGIVASVLSQLHGENCLPVAFYSKTMAPAELNYAVHDKEMLAIIRSFGHFRAELAGAPPKIKVYTDHKALEYFMTSKTLNSRQARWAEILADYDFIITYRPGAQNPLADALTRRDDELSDQNVKKRTQRLVQLLRDDQIDHSLLTKELRPDSPAENLISISEIAPLAPALRVVDQVLQANRNSLSLQALRKQALRFLTDDDETSPYSMEGDLLLFEGRLVVPDTDNLRTLLVREAHDHVITAHPSAKKTYQLLSWQYYWHGIYSYVKQYCRNCHTCRRSMVPTDRKPGLLHPLPVPSRPWEHVTMDYCSFNADRHGYDNVFVVIDRFSKQAISIPCTKKIDARETAKLYIYHIFRYFGSPLSITSDQGGQYISDFWKAFNHILGTKLKLSTADHPQTDGQTEIYNRYLQQRLRPFVSYYQDDWSEFLPMMDYAQLTLPHESLGGLSPFEVVHGYAPRTNWDWKLPKADSQTPSQKLNEKDALAYASRHNDAWNLAKSHIQQAQERMRASANRSRRPANFKVKDKVWLDVRYYPTSRPSKKLDNPMAGPFEITEKVFNSYKLK